MLRKGVLRDLRSNKMIAAVLFVFILLSSLLAASGTQVIARLAGSIEQLLDSARAPHFVQMHAGALDSEAIDAFAASQPVVQDKQIVEMLVVENENLAFGESETANEGSVMDNGFVVQNERFDFLLNLDNERIAVQEGEIAVPLYYKSQKKLEIGDRITIAAGSGKMTFAIADFVRDAQMNPSIISSKRFVVSPQDYQELKRLTGELEYMIEFRLNDLSRLNAFKTAYQSAGLPDLGPAIDYPLFRMLNALTDGAVAAVVLLVSLLLVAIALLCLRFTLVTTLEEDRSEIGVLKALGISRFHIRRMYLAKYAAIAGAACLCGYLLSLYAGGLFTSNMALYMGLAPASPLTIAAPAVAAAVVYGLILFFCLLVLRQTNRISPVEALRSGTLGGYAGGGRRMPLYKSRLPFDHAFMGLRDVLIRSRMYLVLLVVLVICLFLVRVPIQFLHTLQSPSFVTYMGAGKSDLRMDLGRSNEMKRIYDDVMAHLQRDPELARYAAFATVRYGAVGTEGATENILVESGDFSIFPLTYVSGQAPTTAREIALSSLNADSLGKKTGDTLTLMAAGQPIQLIVSGVYQDITNGGRTAKALLPYEQGAVLWYTINADVRPGVDALAKAKDYGKQFPSVKVTHLEQYLEQTLGSTIRQLTVAAFLSVLLALSIAVLITVLFLQMLMAKDRDSIAIMRSLGISGGAIIKQYLVRIGIVLATGILVGTFAAKVWGQGIAGLLMSSMGASSIRFAKEPWTVSAAWPILFGGLVGLAAWIAALSGRKYKRIDRRAE